MGRPPGPKRSFEKPAVQVRPTLPGVVATFPCHSSAQDVPGSPPESACATAPGLGEHSQLTRRVVDRTHAVGAAPNSASKDRAELNGASSLIQCKEE